MNYRHAYHAGNHGDVLKHVVLARVLTYMTGKDKPMALLDAHAGIGSYDLAGAEAFKTGEWREGIGKLRGGPLPSEVGELLEPYLACLRTLNGGDDLLKYPGSPEIARQLLRPTDRLLLNELHPQDNALLNARYADSRTRVTELDALQAIKAALPFAEKRGVVLVDPAYEVPDETDRVLRMVTHMVRRMGNVTGLIWYPVTTQDFADALTAGLSQIGLKGLLKLELMVREPFSQGGLSGSGVVLINPPWTLHDEMQLLLPFLAGRLGVGKWGRATVSWLTPPT